MKVNYLDETGKRKSKVVSSKNCNVTGLQICSVELNQADSYDKDLLETLQLVIFPRLWVAPAVKEYFEFKAYGWLFGICLRVAALLIVGKFADRLTEVIILAVFGEIYLWRSKAK